MRVVVLTGAGDKAFCTGIDRNEALGGTRSPGDGGQRAIDGRDACTSEQAPRRSCSTTLARISARRRCDLWKPVIAAVNGIACGGAFYLLGEVDFIIATEDSMFFDPHVTYGMAAAFEPLQMSGTMPFGELARLTLLGASERLSATRAHQIGLVTELASDVDELRAKAQWAADTIAAAPALAVQGTLRALWAGRDLSRAQALSLGYAFVGLGNSEESLAEGQRVFASGSRREWRLR